MFLNNKLMFHITILTISITQTMFGMEKIPLTHQVIIYQLSQENQNQLGQQPYGYRGYIGYPTNEEILKIATNKGEKELISGYMEQLGLYERITTITERITETPYIHYPTMTRTSREVVGTTTKDFFTTGKDQEYAKWIHSTYKQWIFMLAQQRIVREQKEDRQRNIEWQEKEERRRQREAEEEKKKRELEKRVVIDNYKSKQVWDDNCQYFSQQRRQQAHQQMLCDDPLYANYVYQLSAYNEAKRQHDLRCQQNKVLDELYFVQNNTWADVLKKNDKSYKARRTPEQIQAQDNFNQEEPRSPQEKRLEHIRLIKPSFNLNNTNQSPKNSTKTKPTIEKMKVKFAYINFDETYHYVKFDLIAKINFVIEECNKHNNNSIFTVMGNSVLELNGKQFDLKNLTKKTLLNELSILKTTLLARENQDILEAQNKILSFKEKIKEENALIKAQHEAFIEQLETERKKHEFECACQMAMQSIMQHNEKELIKAFLHMRSFKTNVEFLSPLKDGKHITRFKDIEEHAFKNYFPECNSLEVLREQAHLLATIKYAPCYIRVICEPDQLPIIEPMDTFSNAQELQNFTLWYQSLNDKPWDVNSTDCITTFLNEYDIKNDSFFDSFKYYFTRKPLFTYKQIETVVNAKKVLIRNDLLQNLWKLRDQQDDMDKARVFIKEYEFYYPTPESYNYKRKFCYASLESDGVIEYIGSTEKYFVAPKEPIYLKDPHNTELLSEDSQALWNSFLEFVKDKVGDNIDTIISIIRHDHLIKQQSMTAPEGIIVDASKKTNTLHNAMESNSDEINTISKSSTANKQVLQWTHHGYKHVSPKNIPWKKIVQGTTHGNAVYKPETDIEQLELYAWENGKKTTNGKNWKVFKFDSIIGANSGKETYCVRVECSANTIHGHPISESNYVELLK